MLSDLSRSHRLFCCGTQKSAWQEGFKGSTFRHWQLADGRQFTCMQALQGRTRPVGSTSSIAVDARPQSCPRALSSRFPPTAPKRPASFRRKTIPTIMKEPRPSQWKFGGLTPLGLGKQVAKSISEDDLSGQSAELAYYFFLALFPLLIFLISLLGYFAAAGAQIRTDLMANLARAVPASASQLVEKTLNEVIKARGGGKVIIGALAALWSASAGMNA